MTGNFGNDGRYIRLKTKIMIVYKKPPYSTKIY